MIQVFPHFENEIYAMISDEQPHVNHLVWRRIRRARAEQCEHAVEKKVVIRKFVVPEQNLDCDD